MTLILAIKIIAYITLAILLIYMFINTQIPFIKKFRDKLFNWVKELFLLKMAIVPQNEKWVIFRNGKFHRYAGPGIIYYLGIFEEVRKKVNLKEEKLDIPRFRNFTKDNIIVEVDATCIMKVVDIDKALKKTSNYDAWVAGTVKGAIRAEISKRTLVEVLSQRKQIKDALLEELNREVMPHGIEIKIANASEIHIDPDVQEALKNKVLGRMRREGALATAKNDKEIKILHAEAEYVKAKKKAQAEQALIEAAGKSLELVKKYDGEITEEMLKEVILGTKYVKALEKLYSSDSTKPILMNGSYDKTLGGVLGALGLQKGLNEALKEEEKEDKNSENKGEK